MISAIPPASSHVKGAALREFLCWYTAHRERRRLDEAVSALPLAERGGLVPGAEALGVVPSSWYPSRAARVVLDAIYEGAPGPARARMVEQATQHVVDRMMHGIYAVLFRMVATPERYASHIQRAWRQLHDSGERRVLLRSPTEAESITSGWEGHHPLLCEVVTETMVQVFIRMGCQSVVARRVCCVAEGAADCRVHLRWVKG